MSLCAVLVVGTMTLAGEAMARTGQPLAYVANFYDNTVSVIDTGDNRVVNIVPVGHGPSGVAVTPDGKHVYVSNFADGTVSVIETGRSADKVVETLQVGSGPKGLAVAPDGKHVYVANSGEFYSVTVSVIDTRTNAVATVTNSESCSPLARVCVNFGQASSVAVTPDGKYVYVGAQTRAAFEVFSYLFVLDTATNTWGNAVTSGYGIVLLGNFPPQVAVTPDGKRIYAANGAPDLTQYNSGFEVIDAATNSQTDFLQNYLTPGGLAASPDGKHVYIVGDYYLDAANQVLAIDTALNTVAATFQVGSTPFGVAVTPDGRHVYVANSGDNTVSVIDTATNKVATVQVGTNPIAVGVIAPPQGVPFLAFNAKLDVHFGGEPSRDAFDLRSELTLSSSANNGIHPDSEPVKLQVGPFITSIPAGSFSQRRNGSYAYEGVIDGVKLEAQIEPTGALRYALRAEASGVNLAGTANPVQVSLSIGDDAGLTSVKAHFDRRDNDNTGDQGQGGREASND